MNFKLLWERIGQSIMPKFALAMGIPFSCNSKIKRASSFETDIYRNPKENRMSQICFGKESELNFLLSNVFLLERDHNVVALKIYETLCCVTH